MCTTTYPFDGENICKLYDNIAKAEYSIPSHVSDELHVLITGMLHCEHVRRMDVCSIHAVILCLVSCFI